MVVTTKYKDDGTVERYKTRVVVKGYTKTYRIDYLDSFTSITKLDTIWVLLQFKIGQYKIYVKHAFYHGELQEKVYLEAQPGFSKNF